MGTSALVYAQESVVEDLTDSERRFQEFLKLDEKQRELQTQLDEMIHQDADPIQIQHLTIRIDEMQLQMDLLQQQEIDAVAIDDAQLAVLESQGQQILAEIQNPNSRHYIDEDTAYFVDQLKKTINIVVVDNESGSGGASGETDTIKPTFGNIEGIPFDIEYMQTNSHQINCSQREADCRMVLVA
jgi:hypothetical protein